VCHGISWTERNEAHHFKEAASQQTAKINATEPSKAPALSRCHANNAYPIGEGASRLRLMTFMPQCAYIFHCFVLRSHPATIPFLETPNTSVLIRISSFCRKE
jgi:hypothetical protein